jgi:hypothetical protein
LNVVLGQRGAGGGDERKRENGAAAEERHANLMRTAESPRRA